MAPSHGIAPDRVGIRALHPTAAALRNGYARCRSPSRADAGRMRSDRSLQRLLPRPGMARRHARDGHVFRHIGRRHRLRQRTERRPAPDRADRQDRRQEAADDGRCHAVQDKLNARTAAMVAPLPLRKSAGNEGFPCEWGAPPILRRACIGFSYPVSNKTVLAAGPFPAQVRWSDSTVVPWNRQGPKCSRSARTCPDVRPPPRSEGSPRQRTGSR